MLWKNGVGIYVLSKMLGLANIETTNIYLKKKYAEAE